VLPRLSWETLIRRRKPSEASPPWLPRARITECQAPGVHAPMVAILAHVVEHGFQVGETVLG
jgi:hypothetical protein